MSTVDNKVTGSWWLRLNYTVTNYPDRIVISANGGPYSNSMDVSSSLKMSATCRLMLDDQSTSGTTTFYTITSGTYKSAISGSKTIYKGHEEYWIEAEVTCTEASDASGNITGLYKLAGYSSNVYLGVLPKDNWTVSFNANGGSNSPNSQTKWYNENLTLSTSKPSRTGYSFIKWNTKADGTGTDYNPGASYTANADLTLYAVWYPTVTYNANGGSGAPAQAVKTPGTPIAISTTQPTRAGYTFSKWNTSADGTGTDYSPGASYSTDAPLVLYAQWTPNTYQVSFDANTGKHAPSAINRTYGQPVTLPSAIPVKMAADFVGWATNSSGTGTLYQPGGSYTSTVAAAEILYAVWRSTYTDPAFAIDVVRTDDHGDEEDDGDHALITVLWSINPLIEPDTGESTNTATLECYMSYVNSQGQTVRTEVELEDAGEENELQGTKTSGEARALVSNIDTDTRYTIEVTVVDSRGTSVTKTEILSMAFFTMDFLAGGHGVALGKPSKREMFDVGMQAQFDKPIMVAETDVPPTFYYTTKPSAANLPVHPCVVIQTSDWSVWYCDNGNPPAYHQLADNTKVSKSGDAMTGQLALNGSNILLKTYGSSSNDSGDIVWYYGNGQEKSRIWTKDTYTSSAGPNYRVYKEDGTLLYNGTIACMIAGIICPFGGSSAPSGFLMCNGQAVSRTTYAALFAVIGTTYGGGNGSTTFNVPDLRGRTVIGSNSSHALGSTGGAETVKLSKNESALPAHGHGFTQPTVNGGATTTTEKKLTGWTALYSDTGMFNPGSSYRSGIISQGGVRSTSYRPAWTGGTSYDMSINASHSHPQVAHTHSVTGGAVSQNNGWDASQAHNNMQPFATINYIISTGG